MPYKQGQKKVMGGKRLINVYMVIIGSLPIHLYNNNNIIQYKIYNIHTLCINDYIYFI